MLPNTPPESSSDRPWLSAREAADHLRLPSTKALYQRVARGQIRAYRLGRGLRFLRRDLDRLLAPLGS